MGRLKQREIWKEHPIYTDYEVSNWGQVKRAVDSKSYKKGKILKPGTDKAGYSTIAIVKEGKPKSVFVHRMVIETFVGPCPEGKECNHKDGVKSNNFDSNLEWVTESENQFHAYKNKLKLPMKGEQNRMAKLKDGEVWLIKKLLSNNISGTKIAKMFKIHYTTVYDIKHEKIWKHINL